MIHLAVPNLIGKEAEYAAHAIARGYIGPGGPFVEKFEAMVAKASGRKWAVATITGSAALHAAATVLGFAGKTIVVETHAFPAAANVFRQLGCNLEGIDGGWDHDWAVYRPRNTWLGLADRAPAIGEKSMHAILECYSFAANKVVTCGHGGAIVGDDADMEKSLRVIVHQGRNRSGIYNYRMADINAAIGCAQMERLDELKAAKRRIWQRYADAGLPMMKRGASRWMATITRQLPLDALAEMGIEARHECGGTSLPCSTGITEAELEAVIRACGRFS